MVVEHVDVSGGGLHFYDLCDLSHITLAGAKQSLVIFFLEKSYT